MLPIGTRVTVRKVGHLGRRNPPRRLIGREGVVIDHEQGRNIVAQLTPLDRLTGARVFADTDVTAGETGPLPWLPRSYRVRGYYVLDGDQDVTPALPFTGEELLHAARELNRGNRGPADALVERGGTDPDLRQSIAMQVLAATVEEG